MERPGLATLVCLLATGHASAQTEARADSVTVQPARPLARFEAEVTTGQVPFRVTFRDLSIVRRPSSWTWEFGDGASSAEQHPEHTYYATGGYTVSLTVTGVDGTGTETKTDYIVALDGAPSEGLPPGFVEEEVFRTFTQTTGFVVLGEEDFVVWTKEGEVWRWLGGSFLAQPLVDITEEVANWNDHGLLGFAFDPHYDANGFVYVYYVVDRHHLDHYGTPAYDPLADDFDRQTIGRIARYSVYDPSDPGTSVDPATRTVLVGEDIFSGIPICATSHGLGSLFFGADGSLLFTTGDSSLGPGFQVECLEEGIFRPKDFVSFMRAQLVDNPNGKIHRVDPATGDGLPTNPFYDSAAPRSWASRVWTLGVRQPYRVTIRSTLR